MRAIIYCYGDGHPLILGSENITDADRQAILAHEAIRPRAAATEACDQCGAVRQSWQAAESDRCPNHANPYAGSCDGTLRSTKLTS